MWGLGATVYSLLAGHSPFERLEAGQNTREHLRRRILRATYPRMTRRDVPASLESVLARSMSRNPQERYASALQFAEALRAVQAELGLAQTPIEIAIDEWAPAVASVDFADASVRGGPRTTVPHDSRRKQTEPSPLTVLVRDEDADISGSRVAGRAWPWIISGAAAIVVAVVVVVWSLVAGGV